MSFGPAGRTGVGTPLSFSTLAGFLGDFLFEGSLRGFAMDDLRQDYEGIEVNAQSQALFRSGPARPLRNEAESCGYVQGMSISC